MHHVDIINKLIAKFGFQSYIEIGLFDSSLCFDHIKVADKQSVDPNPLSRPTFCMTSDQFFEGNTREYDLIFIDGDHSFEQSFKDATNALKCLSAKGCLVLHDCFPTTEAMQIVPRVQNEYTGQVWRTIVELRKRNDLEVFVIDADYGCGVVRKGYQLTLDTEFEMTYHNFTRFKKSWLNLITAEQFEKWLKR